MVSAKIVRKKFREFGGNMKKLFLFVLLITFLFSQTRKPEVAGQFYTADAKIGSHNPILFGPGGDTIH